MHFDEAILAVFIIHYGAFLKIILISKFGGVSKSMLTLNEAIIDVKEG